MCTNYEIKFPRDLGSRNIFTPYSRRISSTGTESRFMFSGDNYVLELNYKKSLTLIDMKLLFLIVSDFQNNSKSWSNYYNDTKDIELQTKRFKEILVDVQNKEKALDIFKRENKDIGDYSLDSISKEIELTDYLKSMNLSAQEKNRKQLISSLEMLFKEMTLTWYIFTDKQKKEIVELKKNKQYKDYKEDLSSWFMRNKNKTSRRHRHFINGLDINSSNKVKLYVNKEFAEQTKLGTKIDFSFLIDTNNKIGQILQAHFNFGFKKKASKEYLFDVVNFSKATLDKKKLFQVKQGLDSLCDSGYLKEYSYESKTGMFTITRGE